MIRNVWSVLCKDILTDQETNAVTYIQSIEEGAAEALPIVISQVSIGTLWEKDSEQEEIFRARVVHAFPSGVKKELLQTREVIFNRQHQRLHFKVKRLSITEYGRHEMRVEFLRNGQWQTVSRLPFEIKKLAEK